MATPARSATSHEEVLVPFPNNLPRERVPVATEYRSTWISTSQQTLRAHGLYERYVQSLSPQVRDALIASVAGVWMPVELAMEHYRACDRLGLMDIDLVQIGKESAERAHGTMMSMMVKVAKGAGTTPWTSLGQVQRLWQRSLNGGGGIALYKLGPKEARVEFAGFPFSAVHYVRVAIRGIALGVVELFAETAYAREIPSLCTDKTLAYRLSWV
jgi:hypothetical protein